jgi:hypothetical protein
LLGVNHRIRHSPAIEPNLSVCVRYGSEHQAQAFDRDNETLNIEIFHSGTIGFAPHRAHPNVLGGRNVTMLTSGFWPPHLTMPKALRPPDEAASLCSAGMILDLARGPTSQFGTGATVVCNRGMSYGA